MSFGPDFKATQDRYEREQFDKLMTVVKAAVQNPAAQRDLKISTQGYEPSASVIIPGHLVEKFLKPLSE